MWKLCINCKGKLPEVKENGMAESLITSGLCGSCGKELIDPAGDGHKAVLDSVGSPILLMQPEPRRARTANKSACALFGKDLAQIEGFRGGEVFDCEYAFTAEGCGVDEHCRDCIIRNTIVETFTSGKSFNKVSALLTIRNNVAIKPYTMTISTERVGQLALVRIDEFEEKK